MTRRTAVRTRFAPSPTGYLHIGGARTALFNFLFSRHHGGKYILRIEDTDRERSTKEAIDAILDGLGWLGLDWDEGPFFQSQRTELYLEAVERLLSSGRAYRCVCTAEELKARRERAVKTGESPVYDGRCRDLAIGPGESRAFAVRFRAPREGTTVVDDLVKGRVVFENADLDDLIVLRSDGTPTYNLCAVVDDAEMGITHIIRGDDHLSNTPRQIALYHALGASPPRFGHVPLILGPDKTRLSKRHGAMSVTAYRAMGYLPEAMVNYLARLGWSHGDQEIFTREELIEKFSLDNVGKSAGVFNPEKLLWLNAHYMRALPPDKLARMVRPFIEERGFSLPANGENWLEKMVMTLRERSQTLAELAEMSSFYFADRIEIDPTAAAKVLKPEALPLVKSVVRKLADLHDWTLESIKEAFEKTLSEFGTKLGKVAQPVRVAVTGGTASPGIFEVLELVGRERSIARINEAIRRMEEARTQGSG